MTTRPLNPVKRSILLLLAGALLAAMFAVSTQSTQSASAATNTYQKFSKVIGKSVQGRSIYAYFRGDPSADHQVVIIGQVHGDEKAGTYITRYMKYNMKPQAGTGMWIIPTANPDGFVHNTRQNANGVDINRNFPTNGWSGAASSCCWGGPGPASAPETKALVNFLGTVKPDYIAVMHQPYRVVATNGKDSAYERRLANQLRLPLDEVSLGHNDRTNDIAPSLTSWYNWKYGKLGTSITVEFGNSTTPDYRTKIAAPGLMRATQLWPTN